MRNLRESEAHLRVKQISSFMREQRELDALRAELRAMVEIEIRAIAAEQGELAAMLAELEELTTPSIDSVTHDSEQLQFEAIRNELRAMVEEEEMHVNTNECVYCAGTIVHGRLSRGSYYACECCDTCGRIYPEGTIK